MWQAIAEVVKQGIRNIGNSGKNAQMNGSTAEGGVGLINPDFKKTDSNKQDDTSVAQTTENTSKVETVKQESPAESNVSESSSGSGIGGNSMGNLGNGMDKLGSFGGGNGGEGTSSATSSMASGAMTTSDEKTKNAKDVSTDTKEENWEKVNNARKKIGEGLNKGGGTAQVEGSVANFTSITPTVVSDERLKDIFGEETPIDCFAKIHSYEFKYTPQAQEIMQGKDHVDDKEHLGVMAQELLMNPATSACVIKDTDGFLKVDTAQLTMANTATIAELSRKVQKLEEMLGER